MTGRICRIRGCEQAIPNKQYLCHQHLSQLRSDVRHALLFGSETEKLDALRKASKELSEEKREDSPNESMERFKAARAHAAAAMKTLEKKSR